MKTKLFFSLAAATLVCASCSNEELENSLVESIGQKVTITATIEGEEGQTRSTVTDEGAFSWSEGDMIGVYTTKSEWKTFTYTSENMFDGTLDQDEKTSTWAVYPIKSASVTDEEYTINLPIEYELGSNVNNTNAPMVAWFDEGETDFEFKHLGGVIRFTLTNVPSSATQFVLTADQKINGEFVLTQPSEDENYIIETENTDYESERTTTLEFETATETMTFYVPLPTGTYESMTFSLKDKDGNVLFTRTSTKTKTVVRRSLLKMNPIEATVTVNDEEELRAAIAAGGNVKLGTDIKGISNLIVVEKDFTLDLNGHTLEFTPQEGYPAIKNTANLIIRNGNITSTQVGIQNNGTLSANCNITSVGNAINNVYDGETTIDGGTYKNTSTDKALIYSDNYGDGTPVLTINGGSFESVFTNVSYNNGSTGAVNAGTFKCTGGWHNIYVGGSEGGCNVTYNAANCTFESNGVNIQVNNWGVETNKNTLNDVEYTGVHNIVYASTIASLEKAIAAGGDVALTANITGVSNLLKVEKDLVLDLNGHTLAFTPQNGYPGIKNTANLGIKDSKATGKITSTQVGIQNNGTLVINCDVETEAGNAINNVYDGETTIDGGTYKNTSTDKALIYSDNYGDGTPVLTINGGSFESVFTNVSYNNGSTGAVNAGTFKCTGGWHNIYVGGSEGSCNVTYDETNCTFESNGTKVFVGDMSGTGTKTNTVNGIPYTGNQIILDLTE